MSIEPKFLRTFGGESIFTHCREVEEENAELKARVERVSEALLSLGERAQDTHTLGATFTDGLRHAICVVRNSLREVKPPL